MTIVRAYADREKARFATVAECHAIAESAFHRLRAGEFHTIAVVEDNDTEALAFKRGACAGAAAILAELRALKDRVEAEAANLSKGAA